MLLPELSERLIGTFFDVYNATRYGYLEAVYQRSFAIALTDADIGVESEVPVTVFFRGRAVGDYRLDLIVERTMIVECKSCAKILPVHRSQLLHYLRAMGAPVGFLFNFGPEPSFERIANERGVRGPVGDVTIRRRARTD